MTILITGVAGFIGFHTARRLLERGEQVVGVDSLNHYYDPALKRARLELLKSFPEFTFHKTDISDIDALRIVVEGHTITHVLHLAAQAGVRHSIAAPFSYEESNGKGQLSVLELCRRLPDLEHLVSASSSSVYGLNTKTPFAETDPVDQPASLYAATKRAAELMNETYVHLYHFPITSLRFFTVYGPYGRPDMAYFSFTQKILAGDPITLFHEGQLQRDFTYIDDIVSGVIAAMDKSPVAENAASQHRIYNLGNHQPQSVQHFVSVLENAIGKKAIIEYAPMQPGDVYVTYADITRARNELGFSPTTTIEQGLPQFVEWYKAFFKN